jgi:hypothetical protein
MNERIDIPIDQATILAQASECKGEQEKIQQRFATPSKGFTPNTKATNKSNEEAEKYADEESIQAHTRIFTHCGWSCSKRRGILVLPNNACSTENLHPENCQKFMSLNEYKKKIKRSQSTHHSRPKAKTTFLGNRSNSKEFIPYTSSAFSQSIENRRKTTETFLSPEAKAEIAFRENLKKDAVHTGENWKAIAMLLHPSLKEDQHHVQIPFAPGMKDVNDVMIQKKQTIVRQHRATTPFCRVNEFSKMPKYRVDVPCVRISGPYMTEEEMKKADLKATKKKWMSQKDFQVYKWNQNSTYKMIENFVGKEPNVPIVLHKFREPDKEKWVSGNFKF